MVGQQLRRMFGLPVADGDEVGDGDGDSDDDIGELDFIREYDLTDVDWTDKWERIYINPSIVPAG